MDTTTSRGVIARDGTMRPWEPTRIELAIKSAFMKDANGVQRPGAGSQVMYDNIASAYQAVITILNRQFAQTSAIGIEQIQDTVELVLMRQDQHQVARDYVLYRARKQRQREQQSAAQMPLIAAGITLLKADGTSALWDLERIKQWLTPYADGLKISLDVVAQQVMRDLYHQASEDLVFRAGQMAARAMTERHPDYDKLNARMMLHTMAMEASGQSFDFSTTAFDAIYARVLCTGLRRGVTIGLVDKQLPSVFDLEEIACHLRAASDLARDTLSLSTLRENYLLKDKSTAGTVRLLELPQTMLMRVAMGLAIREAEPTKRALEFYELLADYDYSPATPTLFNSGTPYPQLSSCFLTTVADDLQKIYDKGVTQNAMLQKFAGGLGNDWTPVRAMGALIKSTNGVSQGIIPFLKVVNDTAVAVNQGGKRKGAVCAYLETWHADIEQFLELRKNTGDDRIRTHDMNTANWIPDLFMKRLFADKDWSLFSPDEAPDLHDLYGPAFEQRYAHYEALGQQGKLRVYKSLPAKDLWRKMLTMLFETGHAWITYKDPCNIRSPQKHAGVVHSSNLCTEITLNTSDTETAVCNLGSVNIANHLLPNGDINLSKLKKTVATAMRMLDNVIDINMYTRDEARNSNQAHRPVALGMMGFQDALFKLRLPFESEEAMAFGSNFQEAMCYFAYEASAKLAAERGSYASFEGSDWSRGVFPHETINELKANRQGLDKFPTVVPTMDWGSLRPLVMAGMRNSNCVAIAPTATISNINVVGQSIEPLFASLSVKSNLAGEFTMLNRYLVADLSALGIWDEVMLLDLKTNDGSVARIERVPEDLKKLYKTAFENDPLAVIDHAARRGIWIDQAQSVNVYAAAPSGKLLDKIYRTAWEMGLKTTYYLRTVGAQSAEKSTVHHNSHNAVAVTTPTTPPQADGPVCMKRPGDAGFDECEACQ